MLRDKPLKNIKIILRNEPINKKDVIISIDKIIKCIII